jgi:hypothetical protein
MSGNFVVTSGKQIAAFFSETYGVVCSAYYAESIQIEQYALGPPTAEIIIKGFNPRRTTMEDLGVERPASELSVDELMKIVYQKLDERQ